MRKLMQPLEEQAVEGLNVINDPKFKGPVIIYHLGGGGGVSGDFGGDHLIFRRTEGGSVVTESPKGGDH